MLNFENIVNEHFEEYNMSYDDNIAKTIEEIYKKDKDGNLVNHSFEKWKEFIKSVSLPREGTTGEAKRMEIVQTAIAKHPLLSNEGARQLLSCTILYNSAVNEILKREHFKSDVYKTALDKIRTTELEKVLNAEPASQPPLCEYVMDKILNQAFGEIMRTGKTSTKINTDIFKHSNNSDIIWKMICTNLNQIDETILTNIVNNRNIDESVRDKAFDLGCNWEEISISTLTPHMAQMMYPSVVVYQFDFENFREMIEEKSGLATLALLSKRILNHSLEHDLLSYEQKLDFLNRVSFEKPEYMISDAGELFVTMLIYEKEKDLFPKMIELIEKELPDKQCYVDFLLKNEHFHKTTMFQETIYQLQENVFSPKMFDNKKLERLEKMIMNTDLNSSTIYDTAKNCINILNEPSCISALKHHEIKKASKDLLTAIIKSPHTQLDDLIYVRQNEIDSIELSLLLDISIASRSQTTQNSINPTKILNAIIIDTNNDISIQYSKSVDYEKLLKILNNTKSYVKRFSPHYKLLSQLINTTKGFKKEQDAEKPQRELKDLKNKIDELANPRNIVDFYINTKDFKNEFNKISKELNLSKIEKYTAEER